MHHLAKTIFITCLATIVSSCTQKDTPQQSIPADISNLALVATHAIEMETPISALTFVSNDVASWLGQIIVITDEGKLISVGIEGNAPKEVSTKNYNDIFGLSRIKSAGVFLAINKNNKLEAFVESDDNGNFTTMTYSGMAIAADRFCTTPSPSENSAKVLTTDGEIISLAFTINESVIEQSIVSTEKQKSMPNECAYIQDSLSTVQNTSLALGEEQYFITKSGEKIILIHRSETPKGYDIRIKNGLSIQGLDNTNYIATTNNSYGGASFKDGLMALVDADNPKRIVFISLDYMTREIGKLPTKE